MLKAQTKLTIRSYNERPKYIDKSGVIKDVRKFYGLYPEKPFKYVYRGKQLYFARRIIPIGKVNLSPDYISVIIKVVDYETTFYDLWNFSKDGEPLSVVCLLWGMRDEGPRDEVVTFIIVDSEITGDGKIIWHENDSGLETFRTYQLSSNGYFEIVSEEQKGEFKY